MKTRPGLVQIHIAALLFGGAGLFGKLLEVSPATITLGRSLFGGVALFVAAWVLGVGLTVRSRRDGALLLLGGALLAIHWVTFFRAIQVSSVAIGLLSYASFPLFVVFLEPLLFRERRRADDVALAAAVTVGLALMPSGFALSDHALQGVLWGVASGLAFALLSLLNRSQVRTYPPLAIAFYQTGGAALCLAPTALRNGEAWTPHTLGLLLLLGVVFTALAHTLFIVSLRHLKAQLASVIVSLEPVYGIIFALLLLGEVPSPRTLLGGALILCSVCAALLRHEARSGPPAPV